MQENIALVTGISQELFVFLKKNGFPSNKSVLKNVLDFKFPHFDTNNIYMNLFSYFH